MWALALSAVLMAGGGVSTPDAGAFPGGLEAPVKAKMREAFGGLIALQPDLLSPNGLANPRRREAIRSSLTALSALEHAFPQKAALEEPGLGAVSQLLSRYLAETRQRWEGGDHEFARYRLRTVTSLCFGCHAQMRAEGDFEDLSRQVDRLGLSTFERAEFLAATRQFDRAQQAYRAVLATSPQSEREYLEFLRALRHSLSLSVRVKHDVAGTLQLLNELGARKDLPPFLLDYVASWKEDARRWQKEGFDPAKASVAQLIAKGRALVGQARGPQLVIPDERQDIPFLRATAYVHQALRKEPTSPLRGEALYLLGVSYAALQEPTLWELDSLFLESCVRENPHSAIARRCLRRLTDRVFLGYTGSRGTHVPADELERLSELRRLAK